MKKRFLCFANGLAIVVGAFAALQAVPAMSQAQEMRLEEIVVTARKKEETLQDVPLSVSVFSQETLDKMGLTEFEQLDFNNPNVRMSPSGNGGTANTRIVMRGNVQNDSGTLVDGAVTAYQDGHALAKPMVLDGALVDVESVQTLRGPQGTLFGRNSTGGAVLFQTVQADPDAGLSGHVTGGTGDLGQLRAGGALNVPLSDSAAVRFVADHSERDGYADYSDGSERGDKDVTVARINFHWALLDNTVLEATFQNTDIEGSAAAVGAVDALSPAASLTPHLDDIQNDLTVFGFAPRKSIPDNSSGGESDFYALRLTREFESSTLKFMASHREFDIDQNVAIPPSILDTAQYTMSAEETSYELQYNAQALDGRLDWVGGLYLYDEKAFRENTTRLIGAFGGGPAVFRSTDMDSESRSAYVQGTYSVTDAFGLTAGLRYTDDTKDAIGIISPAGTVSPPFDYDEDDVTYLVSAEWFVQPQVLLYASVGTGYRAGGTTGDSTPAGELRFFSPEEVINYEIGIKGTYLEDSLRINAALFHQKYTDYQFFEVREDAATGLPSRSLQQSDAKIPGGELEVTWLLPGDLTLQATLGFTDSELDDDLSPNDGDELSLVEGTNYSISLTKDFFTSVGDFSLLVAYDWRDSFSTEFDRFNPPARNKLDDVDDLGLLNASLTYSNENWSARLWGTNLTDEKYFTHILFNDTASINGILFGFIAPPRMLGFDVTFNF
jgi:iron complex outermembrane receptor protein